GPTVPFGHACGSHGLLTTEGRALHYQQRHVSATGDLQDRHQVTGGRHRILCVATLYQGGQRRGQRARQRQLVVELESQSAVRVEVRQVLNEGFDGVNAVLGERRAA